MGTALRTLSFQPEQKSLVELEDGWCVGSVSCIHRCVLNITAYLAHSRYSVFVKGGNELVELRLRFYLETKFPWKEKEEGEKKGEGLKCLFQMKIFANFPAIS